MRVNINGGGHQVEIECDGNRDLSYVVDTAKKLWDDTKKPVTHAGFSMSMNGNKPHVNVS